MKWFTPLFLSFITANLFAAGGTLSGSGTDGAPYLIEDYDDLKAIEATSLTAVYRLTGNIDASASQSENAGAGFDPIGNGDNGGEFSGKFHGAGYSILNLHINRLDSSDIGLFARAKKAMIDSLTLTGNILGNSNVGGFIGEASQGNYSYLKNKAIVSGGNSVGGIIGRSTTLDTLNYISNQGAIRGNSSAGGLLGYSQKSIMNFVLNQGSVQAYDNVGGIVGNNREVSISNALNSGFILANNEVGGISGSGYNSSISKAINYGLIKSIDGETAEPIDAESSSGTVSDVYYWDQSAHFINSVSDGSQALTTAQLLDSNNISNFDFTNHWSIRQGASYPGLPFTENSIIPLSHVLPAIEDINHLDTVSISTYDLEDSAVVDIQYYNESILNSTSDSIYVFYQIREVLGTDTVPTGVSWILVPNQQIGEISIASYEDLVKIGTVWNYTLGHDYRITTSFDASASATANSGKGFSPIGSSGFPFAGTLKGAGHTISNLTIHRPTENYVGMISYISEGSSVDSLSLINATVTGEKYVGGIVGYSLRGNMKNLEVRGVLTSIDNYAGMVLGYCVNCRFEEGIAYGEIRGEDYTGGVLGYVSGKDSVMLKNLTNYAKVAGHDYSGGVVGYLSGGDITHSKNYGSVLAVDSSGSRGDGGGIVGRHSSGILDSCENYGSVQGYGAVGGLVGECSSCNVSNSFNTGTIRSIDDLVTPSEDIGGLIGEHSGGVLENSYNTGDIYAFNAMRIGGIVGEARGDTLRNSYNTGRIFARDSIGGATYGNVNSGDTLYHLFSIGKIYADSAFSGAVHDPKNISDVKSYWDSEQSGVSTSLFGAELTKANAFQQSTYTGWDFTNVWKINDGNSYPALRGVNNAPIALNDSVGVGAATFTLSDLLANDYDPDNSGNVLVYKIDSIYVSSNGSVSEGKYVFANVDLVGKVDTLSYRVGEVRATGDTLWGNHAIVIMELTSLHARGATDLLSVNEDDTLVIDLETLLANDTITPSSVSIFAIPDLVSNGTWEMNGTSDSLVYTPKTDFNGLDTAYYSLEDGVHYDTVMVILTVLPVPDTTIAYDTTHVMNKDTNSTIDTTMNAMLQTVMITRTLEHSYDTTFYQVDSLSDGISFYVNKDTVASYRIDTLSIDTIIHDKIVGLETFTESVWGITQVYSHGFIIQLTGKFQYEVYDLKGSKKRFSNRWLKKHQVWWEEPLERGVYFLVIQTPEQNVKQKINILE